MRPTSSEPSSYDTSSESEDGSGSSNGKKTVGIVRILGIVVGVLCRVAAVGVAVSQRRKKNARAGRLAEELSKSMVLTNPVPGRSTTAVVDNPMFKEELVAPAAGLHPQFAAVSDGLFIDV